MKMYNDPALNPAIYRNPAGGTDCWPRPPGPHL